MTMNIYITKANELKLRQEPSMSGLINQLLTKHYANSGSVAAPVKGRDPASFAKLKQNLDVRYEKKGNWGA
jgi:hypothetical protein